MEGSLAAAGVSTSSIALMIIAYKVFQNLKGHRLVSDCCGRKGEIGFDVREMPPTPEGIQSHPAVVHDKDAPKETLSVVVPVHQEQP